VTDTRIGTTVRIKDTSTTHATALSYSSHPAATAVATDSAGGGTSSVDAVPAPLTVHNESLGQRADV